MMDAAAESDSTDDDRDVFGAGRESVDDAHGALKAGRDDAQSVPVAGRESVEDEFRP